MKDYEIIYNEFWKPLVENEQGLDIDQVKKELADYKMLLNEVPKVYMEIAGLSKANTRADIIIAALNDKYVSKEYTLEDLIELADDEETVSISMIKDYLR